MTEVIENKLIRKMREKNISWTSNWSDPILDSTRVPFSASFFPLMMINEIVSTEIHIFQQTMIGMSKRMRKEKI